MNISPPLKCVNKMPAQMLNFSCSGLKPSFTFLVSLLLVAIIALERSEVRADEPDLEIHYTFKPEQCDRKAQATDLLTLHYTGSLADGKIFDSSRERGEPLTFQLGIGHVIQGWDKGLLGVCVGEKRKLVVPPHLGYGEAKHDQIPPKSTLIFEVEIEKIEKGPKPENVFAEIDTDGDKRLSRKEVADYVRHNLAQQAAHGDSATISDPDREQMVSDIFAHEDRDRDGFISHDEFSGPKYNHEEL